MTNWEWLRTLDKYEIASVLAYFADHENHCINDGYECKGCPIAVDGCCGYPKDPCDVSAYRWLLSEHNSKTIQIESADMDSMMKLDVESSETAQI